MIVSREIQWNHKLIIWVDSIDEYPSICIIRMNDSVGNLSPARLKGRLWNGIGLHCTLDNISGRYRCHRLPDCTSVAIGQEWEVHTHLKERYKHPSIYRRVPGTIWNSFRVYTSYILIAAPFYSWPCNNRITITITLHVLPCIYIFIWKFADIFHYIGMCIDTLYANSFRLWNHLR